MIINVSPGICICVMCVCISTKILEELPRCQQCLPLSEGFRVILLHTFYIIENHFFFTMSMYYISPQNIHSF